MSADDSVVNNNEVDNTNPGAPVEDGSRGFLVLAALLTGTLLLLSLFAVGYLLLGQSLDLAAIVGMAFIIVGVVIVNPSPLVLEYYRTRQASLLKARKKLDGYAAILRDLMREEDHPVS